LSVVAFWFERPSPRVREGRECGSFEKEKTMRSASSARRLFGSIACLALAFATGLAADDGTEAARAELDRLAKAYDKALVERDREFLDRLYDDDGVFVMDDGRRLTKQQYLDDATDPAVTLDTSVSEVSSLRIFGDTAIENGTWTATGTRNEKPVRFHLRYSTVWLRRGGEWVITNEQTTPIAIGIPAHLRELIDKQIVGEWATDTTYGGVESTGSYSAQWAPGGHCVVTYLHDTGPEGDLFVSGMFGWDAAKGVLVHEEFASNGERYTVEWTSIAGNEWKGTLSGVVGGKPFEGLPCEAIREKDRTEYRDEVFEKPYLWIATRKR
jgi:ketosteroid isomerase-like protein